MEARDLGRPLKNIRASSKVYARYGIRWIAEPAEDSEKIMARVYKNNKFRRWRVEDLFLAYLMRERFPSITRNVIAGKTKDTRIVTDGIIVLSTPQRLYSEMGHVFLKSDICVFGPAGKEAKITERFKKLKKASTAEKARAKEYIRHASPYLDSLVVDGLVTGVLGRGSYFDRNGFPDPDVPLRHEDINFVLFSVGSDKRTKNRIVKMLKKIPRFAVELIERETKPIKRGKRPAFNFTIVSGDMAARIKKGKYERYVLQYSTRIVLPHLTKAKSEVMARKLSGLLPKP